MQKPQWNGRCWDQPELRHQTIWRRLAQTWLDSFHSTLFGFSCRMTKCNTPCTERRMWLMLSPPSNLCIYTGELFLQINVLFNIAYQSSHVCRVFSECCDKYPSMTPVRWSQLMLQGWRRCEGPDKRHGVCLRRTRGKGVQSRTRQSDIHQQSRDKRFCDQRQGNRVLIGTTCASGPISVSFAGPRERKRKPSSWHIWKKITGPGWSNILLCVAL